MPGCLLCVLAFLDGLASLAAFFLSLVCCAISGILDSQNRLDGSSWALTEWVLLVIKSFSKVSK